MRGRLFLDVEYDPETTDIEAVAAVLDQVLETGLSTPELLEEYGNPVPSEFLVESGDITASPLLEPYDMQAGVWDLNCRRSFLLDPAACNHVRIRVEQAGKSAEPAEEPSELRRLQRLACEAKIRSEALDDLVHDAASSQAARVNNGGTDDQIDYLVAHLGEQEVEDVLRELGARTRKGGGGRAR